MNEVQTRFIQYMNECYPHQQFVFKRAQLEEGAQKFGLRCRDKLDLYTLGVKAKRGEYDFSGNEVEAAPVTVESVAVVETVPTDNEVAVPTSTPSPKLFNEIFVPQKSADYVRWGHSKDIEAIIKSEMFFPTYVAGLSGNGKTMMIEQACAKLKRAYVRIQMTPETDEDDLIGGFRLIDGNTVFVEGPVIKAMRAGAVLLIDEIDRASNRLMALQGVLEGKPVLIKKTHEVVTPAAGFNIIATANTYGQGCLTGNFSAAAIIDEALLERFAVVYTQGDPSAMTETKILTKKVENFYSKTLDTHQERIVETLVKWADTVRKTYKDNAIDSTISTRRLCHIMSTVFIFGSVEKAVELCTNRFEEDTRMALVDLYCKISGMVDAQHFEADTVDQSSVSAGSNEGFSQYNDEGPKQAPPSYGTY